jgi:hypothetical protein
MAISLPYYPLSNTGCNDAKKINADLLAIINHVHIRCVALSIFGSDEAITTGDGTFAFAVPVDLNGYNLTDVLAAVHTKGATNTTNIMVRRRRSGADADMLNTAITIGDEYYANDESINTSNDDLAIGDSIYIDVDAVHTTPPNGLSVTMTFAKP